MFDEVEPLSFPQIEEKVLRNWEQENTFQRSIDQRKEAPLFVSYDGPPFATGLPHYGHLLAGTIKDVVFRYKTMRGYCVPRRFGWDCHGLPVEQEIEKEYKLSGSQAIEAYGIAQFNEACRKIVLRYTNEWKTTVNRMGRWVDFSQNYHTMDLNFMESVWAIFKTLYEKGLIYEGFKVMPFSAKLGTPLSNFEAGENYKDVDDPSLTVKFRVLNEENTFFLAWTTTPWTLYSNLALGVGAEINYVKVLDHKSQQILILAQDRLTAYYKENEEYTIQTSFLGKELADKRYEPLFPHFANHAEKGAFRAIIADFVSTTDGTGIVHLAPAFGESDFYACRQVGIDLVCPVNNNGAFTAEVPEHEGKFVKDADSEIIRYLKTQGKVLTHTTIRHRYPFCYRSDTPLIYRAISTWFVAVEKIKEKLLASNESINWIPNHIKHGRFGKWLEGARDWAISRNRYWGTPIPIWRAADGELHVMGSVAELEQLTGQKVADLHRHYIDDLTFVKNGKTFQRIKEVFDCWFESGSMPYAQNHYPFENQELFKKTFPADFIVEGLDQTRGWFYTLTILATALFDQTAFKNVIVNGIILAEDGNKMSKRLKNYPDPELVISRYGADAIRLYMLNSPAVKAEDLRFSERGVELVLRQVMIPLWNAYQGFFITYARIYNWKPQEVAFKQPQGVMDRWILSLSQKLIADVANAMDQYDLSRAVGPFVDFIDQLTNWYIRRCRRRFWDDQHSSDRNEAFSTLYQVLLTICQVAAPFIPFITEAIYRNLRTIQSPDSVHLCEYPTYNESARDIDLEQAMALVQRVTSLGHALRKEHKLKVRQPLPELTIITSDHDVLTFLQKQQQLVADELNVKKIVFSTDEQEFVSLVAKPNFRLLGKKVGKQMRAVQDAIAQFTYQQLNVLQQGKNLTIIVEGEQIELSPEEIVVERVVKGQQIAANEGVLTVVLNTQLTEELIIEGLAREIVNKVNTLRKELDFAVTDRIKLIVDTTSTLVKISLEKYQSYISHEVLALEISVGFCEQEPTDLNGELAKIYVERIAH
ncbi:MAG: ileS [Chlamydiales bacterium]|jgi:isoleucyl-tRNA synthetase|nr:ileS [Chlamydiales bacterium]